MKYSVSIYGCSNGSQAPVTALNFCKALIHAGHSISLLFLYSNGVCNASDLLVVPQSDPDTKKAWKEFITINNIEANVCITSALCRGILDPLEAKRYGKKNNNLSQEYSLSSLSHMLESSTKADRFIAFGI